MKPFATLEDIEAVIDHVLDDGEKRDAEGALEEASMLVRYYGRPWPDAAAAPAVARLLTLRSVKRYLKNPDGYTQSRAGDEAVGWDGLGDDAGAPYLTAAEQKMLAQAAGRSGIASAPISPWGALRDRCDCHVPCESGKPFPFYGGVDGCDCR